MPIFTSTIVGTRFRPPSAMTLLGLLPKGAHLLLQREPLNKHDANATAVYHGDEHLGYLPAGDAATLAPILDRLGLDRHDATITFEAIIDHGSVRFGPKLSCRLPEWTEAEVDEDTVT